MKTFLIAAALCCGPDWPSPSTATAAPRVPTAAPMQDVAGVHAELVVAGNAVTINILDENNKPTRPRALAARC